MTLEELLKKIEDENLEEYLSHESQVIVREMVDRYSTHWELSEKEKYQFRSGAYEGYKLALKAMIKMIRELK